MSKDMKPSNPPSQTAQAARGEYKPNNIGYPVERADMTWQDLTPQQRQEWFQRHEQRWKTRFGATSGSMQANMNWTRG